MYQPIVNSRDPTLKSVYQSPEYEIGTRLHRANPTNRASGASCARLLAELLQRRHRVPDERLHLHPHFRTVDDRRDSTAQLPQPALFENP